LGAHKNALSGRADWNIWLDWYEDRLAGRSRGEAHELIFASVPKSEWEKGPAAANAWIAARLAELNALKPAEPQSSAPAQPVETSMVSLPTVPTPKPAALEPIIRGNRLTLPKKAVESRLRDASPAASLKALKKHFDDLARDAEGEANIDRRMIAYLCSLGERMPMRAPAQDKLISLGHEIETLQSFAKSVNEEWPPLLAARYHSLHIAFDKTWRQFPKWRDFLSKTARHEFTAREIEETPRAIKIFSDALASPEVARHVDPAIPEALDKLSTALNTSLNEGHSNAAPNSMSARRNALAADALESINNSAKSVAEAMLDGVKASKDVAGEAATSYAREFRKEFVAQAGKQGKKRGGQALIWTERLLFSVVGTGVLSLAHYLIGAFPEYFGWLTSIIVFMSSVSVSTAIHHIRERKRPHE
jgi:hypothetical protein